MEHNKIASIEGENMILCDTDSTASTKFNMPQVETLMAEVCQPMDMEEEHVFDNAVLVPLRTSMDIDTVVVPQQVLSGAPAVVVKNSAERVRIRKPRGPYRRYTAHQVEQLFDYVIAQGKMAKEASLLTVLTLGRRNTTSKNTTMTKNNACTPPIVATVDHLCSELKERIPKPVTAETLSASPGTFVLVLKLILKELKKPHEAARNSRQSVTEKLPRLFSIFPNPSFGWRFVTINAEMVASMIPSIFEPQNPLRIITRSFLWPSILVFFVYEGKEK
jgi:hypothetical protein